MSRRHRGQPLFAVRKKSASGFAKQFLFKGDYAVVRYMLLWKIRRIGQISGRQKPFLAKSSQIYEQGISGKCREALVRGIAVSSGAQWQYLPDFLP